MKKIFLKIKNWMTRMVSYNSAKRLVVFTLGIAALLFWGGIIVTVMQYGLGKAQAYGEKEFYTYVSKLPPEELKEYADVGDYSFVPRLKESQCVDLENLEFIIPLSYDTVVISESNRKRYKLEVNGASRSRSLSYRLFNLLDTESYKLKTSTRIENFIINNIARDEKSMVFDAKMNVDSYRYFLHNGDLQLLVEGDLLRVGGSEVNNHLYIYMPKTKKLETVAPEGLYLDSYKLIGADDEYVSSYDNKTPISYIFMSYYPLYADGAKDDDGYKYNRSKPIKMVYDLNNSKLKSVIGEDIYEWIEQSGY